MERVELVETRKGRDLAEPLLPSNAANSGAHHGKGQTRSDHRGC